MIAVSTWWRDGERLHVSGSFGRCIVRPVAIDRLRAIDDVLSNDIEGLLKGGNRRAGDFDYVLFGHSGGHNVQLEIPCLEALDRALVEVVDLGERHLVVRAEKLFHRDLHLNTHLLKDGGSNRIETRSGIVLAHRHIASEQRLMIRAKAAARHRLVEDMLALRRTSSERAA